MGLELHLERLAVELDIAAREARSRTQAKGRGLTTFSDDVQHKLWLRDLLREMTTIVNRTARGSENGAEPKLYVWPGYDSILFGGRRVAFEVDLDVRHALASFGYENGLSAEGHRSMQTGVVFPRIDHQRIDRATLYFDAALASIPSHGAAQQTTFSVGSTHNWLALNPTVEGEPLIGFEVRTTPGSTSDHRSLPVILLDGARPLEWGETIAKAIRDACGDNPRSFWPLPVRRQGETHTAYTQRLEDEHAETEHRSIRERLYSLWLIGCFAAEPGRILLEGRGPRWIERLIRDLDEVEPERARRVRALLDLERNAAAGTVLPIDPVHFDRWGVLTIPYPIADVRSSDDGEESDELGSGMFLYSFDLPSWYYFVIRQWIASYYLSLRQQESSVIRAEREAHKAALHAARELRRQLSHAVGTELTYVQFLLTEIVKTIAKSHFNPDVEKLRSGVVHLRKHQDARLDLRFTEKSGKLSAIEKRLAHIIVDTNGHDQLTHDVALVERSLAAMPVDEGRKILTGLIDDVRRITLENRALVRVDEPTVIADLERSTKRTTDEYAERLIVLLGRALLAALTVYFRKAFPPNNETPEAVCLQSAEALFGRPEEPQKKRREIAQACANAWREFVARSYRTNGCAPSYANVRTWLSQSLATHARLRMELPDPKDIARIKPGCGEYVPLVLQAWLTEVLVNALKHSRPADSPTAVIRVEWMNDNAILELSNTTTAESAAVVVHAAEAAAHGSSSIRDGHQGLAFLCYASEHLFRQRRLSAEFERDAHLLRLRVK